MEAAGERVTAKDVIIATGSSSAMLPIDGNTLEGVLTSRELLDIDSVPQRLCIVGAGVIGLEFASVFSAFGSEVTVLEYAKEVLPHFDSDLAKRLRQSLGKRGIKIETQAAVKSIAKEGDGLAVAYERKGKEQSVTADNVLMAVGRRANVGTLNLADIGVEFSPRGIAVDGNMQTNVPHVYAVGDVNGLMMLAHAATFQGIRALDAIMGVDDNLRLDVIPAAVFTMPEVGMVGLTEDDCKAQGIEYVSKRRFPRQRQGGVPRRDRRLLQTGCRCRRTSVGMPHLWSACRRPCTGGLRADYSRRLDCRPARHRALSPYTERDCAIGCTLLTFNAY